jgi:hypothetical protein
MVVIGNKESQAAKICAKKARILQSLCSSMFERCVSFTCSLCVSAWSWTSSGAPFNTINPPKKKKGKDKNIKNLIREDPPEITLAKVRSP